ncbi:ATP-binding protein [Deinococcus koreensis]|nr:tetratricopeptide repeat protein [Deinococcus koreensis]
MSVLRGADQAASGQPALVGRDYELVLAQELLMRPQVRVLVVRGPGGVGKTRLAREVQARLNPNFDLGAVFVNLAPLSGEDQVLPAICRALDVRDAGSPLDALSRAVGEQGLLLVLDNLEHLPNPEGDIVALCARLPGVRLLVTSRRVLRVRQIHELPLAPLALPLHPEGAASSAAVQLFVQRAQEVEPDFSLTPDNTALVTAVCRALDGLPLALELAAARLRTVDLTGLLGWLETPLEVLDGGPLDDAPRSRSLRDAVRWSYDLLTPGEQAVFTACGVFVGGFTLDALEAVTARPDARATLIALVEHSLIQRAEGTPPRWQLLEPVREFAAEILRASPDAALLAGRHARFYLELAEETDALEMRPSPERMARLATDEPNLLAALEYFMASSQAMRAQALAYGLVPFWFGRGHPAQGMLHLQRVLDMQDSVPGTQRANLYGNAAGLASRAGFSEQAERWARMSLALYRDLNDSAGEADALATLADMLSTQGNHAEAIPLIQQALARLEALGNLTGQGVVSHNLAATLSQSGQYRASMPFFEQALKLWHQLEHPIGEAYTRGVRAVQHLRHHELDAGRIDARRAWQLGRDFQDVIFREALLFIAGLLAARLGHQLVGVRLAAASEALRTRASVHLPRACYRERDELIAELRAALPPADFAAAWEQGTQAGPEAVTADLDCAMQTEAQSAVSPPDALTPRELEVLAGVAQGHSDKRVAQTLGISPGTVGKHVANMLGKLELHNRVELARWALERHVTP